MRVDTEWWEVVSADGGGHTRFDTRDEAVANRGDGQVRRRVSSEDVPVAYQVRLDGQVLDTKPRAADAATVAKANPGATVHMVPATAQMVGAKVPGCRGCAKTPHGGRVHVPELGDGDRYEVRRDGAVLDRFRSVVAAATFATGKPGATVHTAKTATGDPDVA